MHREIAIAVCGIATASPIVAGILPNCGTFWKSRRTEVEATEVGYTNAVSSNHESCVEVPVAIPVQASKSDCRKEYVQTTLV